MKKDVEDGKAKKQKKPKDPAAPKRALGAYNYYTRERVPQLRADPKYQGSGPHGLKVIDGKEMGVTHFMSLAAEEWKTLSESQKSKYQKLEAEDKKRK